MDPLMRDLDRYLKGLDDTELREECYLNWLEYMIEENPWFAVLTEEQKRSAYKDWCDAHDELDQRTPALDHYYDEEGRRVWL